MGNQVLAMYDVRGIQNYIFKTKEIKDAMGASALVENIILESLEAAVKEKGMEAVTQLAWLKEQQDEKSGKYKKVPLPFIENSGKEIEVLFIGGGNAFVIFASRECCREINKVMSRYIIEKTYSLQLAVAIVDKTEDYAQDYSNLYQEMNRIKANMSLSKPLSTLPVMEMEYQTGYPVVKDGRSSETLNKIKVKEQQKVEDESRFLDNLITKKGIDSTLAVVHMDGNNMGLRIRELIQGIVSYEEAVNKMRTISYNITSGYLDTFEQMKEKIESISEEERNRIGKENDFFIRKILVAGDDITYVCNAKIALSTVEYYSKEISKKVMYRDESVNEEKNRKKYGFSVCAGIAYMSSHFPFRIAYDTAEECCEKAKKRAKKKENKDGERIGNYVDFQICKNIQCRELDRIRKQEYETPQGENLLIRPYYITTNDTDNLETITKGKLYCFKHLKRNLEYFQEEKNLPRNFAKKLRNMYSLGKNYMQIFVDFLESRNYKMPDETMNMFDEKQNALWYDALELLDLYVDFEWGREEVE